MSDPTTDLGRLHDLVLPPAVPWWPPAPGWCGLLVLLVLAAGWLAWRWWKNWRANAYRRAALRALEGMRDAGAIAELLRRAALAIAPRHVVASMTGSAWTDWLAGQSSVPMSAEVRRQLIAGIYGSAATDRDIDALRDFAARWIAGHHPARPGAEGAV